MSVPSTIAPVQSQDFTLTPMKVHKKFSLSNEDFETTSSGYSLTEGYHSNIITPIGSAKADNDPRNEVEGSYKHIMWKHINHMYYENPFNPLETFEHSNRRYTNKILNATASIISLPYLDYGEMIKKGSVVFTNMNTGKQLLDDSKGNLYDPLLPLDSFYKQSDIIFELGFNEEFKKFKYYNGHVKDDGNCHEVSFVPGVSISGPSTGMCAGFGADINQFNTASYTDNLTTNKHGYILLPSNDKINFDSTEEFGIQFWFNAKSGNNGKHSILSKNGVEFKDQNGVKILINENTDVYPYEFSYDNGKIKFKRSDGIDVIELEYTATANQWNLITLLRYTDNNVFKIGMYLNGVFKGSAIDNLKHPMNNHSLMIGSKNMAGLEAYEGFIDEIKFINKVRYDEDDNLDDVYYAKYYDNDNIYPAYIGNIFYRRGNIVLSPLNSKYKTYLSGDWKLEYRGTHTIYQYEVLCRIRKGDFNLTQNPSGLQSPKSDLLINDLTGSELRPYVTTVGLYNDRNELMAVAKLGQAVQMREDVDINIAVRWDV